MGFKRAIIAVGLAIAGCAQPAPQPAAPVEQGPVAQAPQTPAIVRVVSRDLTITAHTGQNGPVYAVQSTDGEVIVPGQSLEDLQVNEPQLARHIQMMQADTWAGLD
jgi:hypothetical protein